MGADLRPFGPAPPRRARQTVLLIVERLLLLVGLAAIGYVAGSVGAATLYQDYESRELDEVLRGVPAAAAGTTPAAVRRVLGRLEIPALGVSTIVREGEDARTLQLAIGHIAGTAMPGAQGNMGLAGHRDTFFRRLREINPGDVIRLVAVEGTFTYVVDSTHVVNPDDVWVLDSTPEPSLTLVTCYPFTYLGAAPERFIVRARLAPAKPSAPALSPLAVKG